MYHHTILYSTNIDLDLSCNIIGNDRHNRRMKQKAKSWIPPSLNWFKWNTDASRIEAKKVTTISYVCKDDQ